MANEPFAKRKKLDLDVVPTEEVDANDVIKFRLLDSSSNASDLMEEASFAPGMAHQFFGDDEACVQHHTCLSANFPRRPFSRFWA